MGRQPRATKNRLKKRRTDAGQRKARLDRAEELAAVALDLFAERNFASVTIKDIARENGINAALIYYYFDSKEDLFRASIEYAVDQAFKNFRQLQVRHDNPADIINDWLDNHVQLFAPIHKFVKVSLDYSGSDANMPVIDRQIRQFYDEESRILSECIRRGIREGVFQHVDPEDLAQFISTYLDGVMVRSVILGDFDLTRAVERLRREIWQQLKYQGADDRPHDAAAGVRANA
jgi:AcrR family transcriptional regulator